VPAAGSAASTAVSAGQLIKAIAKITAVTATATTLAEDAFEPRLKLFLGSLKLE
jgi:hypothetical protein